MFKVLITTINGEAVHSIVVDFQDVADADYCVKTVEAHSKCVTYNQTALRLNLSAREIKQGK